MSTAFVRALLMVVCSLTSILSFSIPACSAENSSEVSPERIRTALDQAITYYRRNVSAHGGYVYFYSLDLQQRWGEGRATADQIWVQSPGTPAVGMAYLRAYEATGNREYLEAAEESAEALVYGQLRSGGWTHSIDFDPRGEKVALYRNGRGRGRNYSTLDDGTTQQALRLIMHVDRALQFKNAAIHEASVIARRALLAAQFPSGGFPQVWTGPVDALPIRPASYPDYDWRTENRVKEYWHLPTLNDGLAGDVFEALEDAWKIYRDEECRRALVKLGDFLLLAQMPEPQPAWAQQYDRQMRPAWARKFEPPAIASRESEDAMLTLIRISQLTSDGKYLEPLPRAVAFLRMSMLPDGQMARYYELKTNRPLYMTTRYELTYGDDDLPAHYGWKLNPRLDQIERELRLGSPRPHIVHVADVQKILRSLDSKGRWVSRYEGQKLVGQPKFPEGFQFLASDVFCRNVETLSQFLIQVK